MTTNNQRPRPLGRAKALALPAVLAAALASCALPPATPVPDEPAPAVEGEAAFSQRLVVDVDPLRGAAFERPMRQLQQAVTVSGALRVAVEFPQVRHDAATGRTTVTMQITNAGDSLTFLKCVASSDRPLISPAWGFNTTIAKAGASQTVDLIIENPGATGFTVNFTFTGTLNTKGTMPVGGSPSAGPSPTPSISPSAAPSPSPTSAPTTSPGAGGLTATASSSYGSLGPQLAIDGNMNTQWSNGGYQEAEAWLRLDAGAIVPANSLSLKMRPQSGGATYVVEASDDGRTFRPVSGPLKNSSWNMETKALPAGTQARYLRLRFVNDPASPEVRFSVFEAQWNGASSPAATPTPAPTPTPTPTPSAPASGGRLNMTFESFALGSDPADFIDPRDEGHRYSWLVDAPWRIATHDGSKQYMHDGLSNMANLSFRRYRGTAFGPNGQMPNRYFSEVAVTPIKSYTYQPTGDQGTQQYYLNPTNYVEVVIKPDFYEVWAAVNAEPFQGKGWQRLYYTNLKTQAGQTRRIGAEVDAHAGTFKVYLDGQYMSTVTHSMLNTQPHYFALRGTGNIVVHDNLIIEPR